MADELMARLTSRRRRLGFFITLGSMLIGGACGVLGGMMISLDLPASDGLVMGVAILGGLVGGLVAGILWCRVMIHRRLARTNKVSFGFVMIGIGLGLGAGCLATVMLHLGLLPLHDDPSTALLFLLFGALWFGAPAGIGYGLIASLLCLIGVDRSGATIEAPPRETD
ncbi:MAG: hypothetical protein LLG01_03300 [Planctomycetaceae bacterium]|nr:hypothetical protein [Planctomycetaceae bacterium]